MTSYDSDKLGEIYEGLDFKSSFEPEFDPYIEKHKAEANALSHHIEEMLSGVITYYKRTRDAYAKNPRDMGSFEDLQKLQKFLQPHLAQYSQFKD